MTTIDQLKTAVVYPIGLSFSVSFDEFAVDIVTLPNDQLRFTVPRGPFARTETVETSVVALRPGLFLVSWKEQDGSTVIHVEDFVENIVHSRLKLSDGRFLQMKSKITDIVWKH